MEYKLPKKCQICYGPFKDPKVLPCFHIVCRECIRSLQVPGMKNLKCPVDMCTKSFTFEDMDPEYLQDASVVYSYQDLDRLKEKLRDREINCDVCYMKEKKNVAAVASCNICNYICKKCSQCHSRDQIKYSDHNVLGFTEIQERDDDSLHMEVLKRSRTMSFVQQTRKKCRNHPAKEWVSYCLDCREFVCRACIKSSHSTHCHKPTSLAAERCKEVLEGHIPTIKFARKKLLEAANNINTSKISVENQRKSISSNIDSTFEYLRKLLQKRQQEMHSKLNNLTDSKLHNLSEQEDKLRKKANELERMMTFTKESTETSTDRELLSVYPFLHQQIRDNSESMLENDLLHPVETANTALKFSLRKEFPEMCRKGLDIYSEQANPGSCSIDSEGLKMAETLHYSQFTLNVVDKNRKPCPSVQDVGIKLKCCENGYETPALVHDGAMGRYRVSFCPEFRGEHEVHVVVNGKPIAGSPFALRVRMPPTQLGMPQGCLMDVSQPRGIVLTPKKNNIMICEWNGNRIIEMDRFGRRVRALGSDDIQHPTSLAISSNEEIYVVVGTGEKSGVMKWGKGGKLLKAVRGEGSKICQFKSPRGVKISHGGSDREKNQKEEEIFVCDRDNHRIQVFDMHLEYMRSIDLLQSSLGQLKFAPKPNDLAFDRTGNMYVTDYANNCVHHFNREERYLSSFSESKDGELGGPEGITVDNSGYLYVTESHSHRVSVFNTSGECISAFGRKGLSEGEFNFPMGITVDAIGTVFVCELLNNRIQVF